MKALFLSLLLCLSWPLQAKIGNEVFYYLFVDRFHDGDKSNNIPTWAFPGLSQYDQNNRYWLDKMYDPSGTKLQNYLGGDIRGIIQKLDYLAELGVTAIIISPIFENVNGINYNGGETAYHGYWTKDYYRIEEHFAQRDMTGVELVKELLSKAHGMGMKVILDLSLNHSSPTDLSDPWDYNLEHANLYKDGQLFNRFCLGFDEEDACIIDYNNPIYNHTFKKITDWDDLEEVEDHFLYSLADYNQRNPEIKQYLWGAIEFWLQLGFDGFRIDAIKHIFKDYLLELEQKLVAYRPDIILIGEYFDGGMYNDDSTEWLETTQHFSMFDFSLATSIREFFSGKTNWRGTPYHLEQLMDSANQDLLTFINNHDLPRFRSLEEADDKEYRAALAFLLLSRGVPKLNYGDEIGLALPYDPNKKSDLGTMGDPWCRNMMKWNLNANEQTTLKMTKKLIRLRKHNLALRYGESKLLEVKNTRAQIVNFFMPYSYLAMQRKYKEEQVYFFYSTTDQTGMEFDVELPDGNYTDLIGGGVYQVKEGTLRIPSIGEKDIIVLQLTTS